MYRLRFLKTIARCLATPTQPLESEFRVRFLAWPFLDTDVTRLFTHAYAAWLAIARWHYVFHSPLRNAALRKGWTPVTTAESLVYRRSIKAFTRVTVRTRLLCWTDERFFLEQDFLVGDVVHAQCLLEGLLRGPKGVLRPPEVFRELGLSDPSPAMPTRIAQWVASRG